MHRKTAVVFGGTGFIGHHIARRLKREGYWVRTVDIKRYAYGMIDFADDYVIGDLRDKDVVKDNLFDNRGFAVDELYVLSSFMGGAFLIFSRKYDDEILHNSLMIDLNVAKCASEVAVGKVFWSSSACCYNADIQQEIGNTGLKESDAYPANPDSDYGFAKLTSERIYQAFHRNKGLNIRIARFHNIFGIESEWNSGKEKFPAAACRKVSEATNGSAVEIWGDGLQERSFLCINEAVEGVLRLMDSNYTEPVNIGSSQIISINDLTQMVIRFSGKDLKINNVPSDTLGVRSRVSDNTLCKKILGWEPSQPLWVGMEQLYHWVNDQVHGK